jgi:hypothetical protein
VAKYSVRIVTTSPDGPPIIFEVRNLAEIAGAYQRLRNEALGRAHRAQQRARSIAGVTAKRDARQRGADGDEELLTALKAQREKHPSHSLRAIASNLVSRFGSHHHKSPVDALRKRLARLERRK